MSRDRHTEDAYAYFTARARVHGVEIPFDLAAYHEEVQRRASRDSYAGPFGQPPFHKVIEVITDPRDRRGFDARRVN